MTIDIYSKKLLHLAAGARAHGRLQTPDASVTVDNPLCGDRVTIDLTLDGGRITDIAQEVRACVLCQASVSILGGRVRGHSPAAIERLADAVKAMLDGGPAPDGEWADFSAFAPVQPHLSRHRCVMLPFEALAKAVAKAVAEAASEPR